jgi:hypothetical protein
MFAGRNLICSYTLFLHNDLPFVIYEFTTSPVERDEAEPNTVTFLGKYIYHVVIILYVHFKWEIELSPDTEPTLFRQKKARVVW